MKDQRVRIWIKATECINLHIKCLVIFQNIPLKTGTKSSKKIDLVSGIILKESAETEGSGSSVIGAK